MAERIGQPTGFTALYAWGLNPNDLRPDGTSKVREYIAGVAVKASTNRNHVHVSVYDLNDATNNATDHSRLNDCENDGTYTYSAQPDVASTGTLNGLFVNLTISSGLQTRCATPAWTDITLGTTATRTLVDGLSCTSFVVGGTAAIVGLNTADTDPNRGWCPNATYSSTSRGISQCM